MGGPAAPLVVVDTVVGSLFPERCFACRDLSDSPWCLRCHDRSAPIKPPFCSICGEPGSTGLCVDCATALPAFDSARSVYRYEGPVRDLIRMYKFGGYRRLEKVLAEPMIPLVREAKVEGAEILIPVPSEPLRQWRRGFNPPERLAQYAAEAAHLTLQSRALARRWGGQPQVGLDVQARHASVRERFRVLDASAVASRNVLLLDDVFTTGATVAEVARTVKLSGAADVHVVTLARR